MKKSAIFFIIALVTSLIAYVINVFTFLAMVNNTSLSNSYEVLMYIDLISMIITIPLFVICICQLVKSVKQSKDVPMVTIILLLVNLIVMFGLYSYSSVYSFKQLYYSYESKMSESEDVALVFKVLKQNLIYSFISGYIIPIVYLLSSTCSLIFKYNEKAKLNNIDC